MIFAILMAFTSCSTNDNQMRIDNQSQVGQIIDFDSLNNEKKCWGQGYNVNEKNQPTGSVDYNNKYGKYDAIFMGDTEKTVYLTFDE